MADVNPYESPKASGAPPVVTNRSTLGGALAIFTVRTPEPHEVEIYFSRWTGLEVYRIDGVERLRHRSFSLSGRYRFEIEGPTPHVLEVAVNAFPWWRTHALLDGCRVIDDLFPSERQLVMRLFVTVLVTLLVLGGIGLGLVLWSGSADGALRKWLGG